MGTEVSAQAGKWSHGKTIPVKNVQALAANTAELTPAAIERYIRPERSSDIVLDGSSDSIPVINLGRLLDLETSEEEAAKLKFACEDWGFFQDQLNVELTTKNQSFLQKEIDKTTNLHPNFSGS
ncbi:hypothetical protein E2562_016050 [Oryza meyeriana var. granulata]|uniref:Non-haem dioxygenase N-terminal domain-containing protein n=1 Tax=Oryza meyeriana var. granulata TaxID=110450 RepID=A0A6G1BLA0_9ORYZ|nr:hypothetical protein E2562_016050 [Oryza meyeriana var. granulata]